MLCYCTDQAEISGRKTWRGMSRKRLAVGLRCLRQRCIERHVLRSAVPARACRTYLPATARVVPWLVDGPLEKQPSLFSTITTHPRLLHSLRTLPVSFLTSHSRVPHRRDSLCFHTFLPRLSTHAPPISAPPPPLARRTSGTSAPLTNRESTSC